MKIKNLFAVAFLLIAGGATVMAQAPQMPPVPVDKDVRIGKLANGLTYYIRHNGWPEHRVNFYIAQRVGSIQEEESQRGLAHFLEHMAFNGSTNYPGSKLLDYTRSIGVEFGRDLNAYTAIDRTVYNINNVPSTRIESIDSCLLVLKDWSNGLLLEGEEIDKERGVIHEEWRMRTSGQNRMFERNLEALYPGSKYGKRFPIGLMSVIDNFKYDELRNYYHKWYHPANQAIIIVGDVDVDRTEAKIKEMFSSIPAKQNAAPIVVEQVPDNAEPIIIIDKDKEMQMNQVQIMYKHDATPDAEKNSWMYYIEQYATNVMTNMLSARLAEAAQDANCPFVAAGCYDGNYIFAKSKDALSFYAIPKEGKTEEAAGAVLREALRAQQFGFTATEYARAQEQFISSLEKVYTNRAKRNNDTYGTMYADNYLDNEPIPSIEDEYMTMAQIVPNIPVEMINQLLPEIIKNDSNLVIMNFNTEKEGAKYATKESMKKMLADVHAENLTAYVDNVKNEPLIAQLPAKGKIVKEKENKALGFKTLTLSNGVKVNIKKTDYKDDQVLMSASSKGGASLLDKKDLVNKKMFDDAIEASGLGAFDNKQLTKALAGKQVGVSLSLANLHEIVSGQSTPKDLETMFQLTYLYFTDIKKDEKSYASMISMYEATLKNKALSPEMAFSDSLTCTLYAHNPAFKSLEVEDVKAADYDRILQIAKERTANAADFVFTIVGNYDEAKLREYLEQYIATLPASKGRENWKPYTTYAKGQNVNQFERKMETPKSQAYMYWYNNSVPYTEANAVNASAAGQVLDMIYLKEIREEASAAYSASAAGFVRLGGDVPFAAMVGVCPFKPEKTELALSLMRDEAKGLCNGVDADMLTKVKAAMLKNADTNAKTNGYWMNVIDTFDEYGVDTHTNYKKAIEAITPATVQKFVKTVIFGKGANSAEVVMLPAK